MTTETEKVNGWTNRETWLVNLWFDTSSMIENDEDMTVDDIAAELESLVRGTVEDGWPEPEGIIGDFLPSLDQTMREINFQELAHHIKE